MIRQRQELDKRPGERAGDAEGGRQGGAAVRPTAPGKHIACRREPCNSQQFRANSPLTCLKLEHTLHSLLLPPVFHPQIEARASPYF